MVFDEQTVLYSFALIRERTFICPECGRIIWPKVNMTDKKIIIEKDAHYLEENGYRISRDMCYECAAIKDYEIRCKKNGDS